MALPTANTAVVPEMAMSLMYTKVGVPVNAVVHGVDIPDPVMGHA